MTTERRVIFVPDDYWTNPPKENTMNIDPHHAADLRRAGVCIKHHVHGNQEGVNVVLEEVNDVGRSGQFVHSLLATLDAVSKQLLTEPGLRALDEGLATVANPAYDPSQMVPEYWRRAACLTIAYGRGDQDGVNAVWLGEESVTPITLSLIDVYAMLIPSISTSVGMQIVDNGISTLVGIEAEGH
ncbi:Uncharacterised protein [Mycobacteroides abscessus subsp. bolletii]|uniref:hypothetical protein n=1 Tax=Mycobacteroides abscessus TaxID=36809 RepID=UPI000929858A|nr:hypothetical protein [Mycobacteroides abscessus]SII79846.1 Uncharacterised protein [Mycobacteroides abscessus subsp. bolletii]SLD55353.1 Uncharacterised protein [Mycobacteroides abscessus subsp. bolletii]SLE99300.1 Uncharacterised protein [Mycobacteroides abscessus subsp. bolletii]